MIAENGMGSKSELLFKDKKWVRQQGKNLYRV